MINAKNVQTLQQKKVLPQGSLFFHLIFPASAGAAQRWIFRDPFRGKGETLGFGRERGNFHEETQEERKEAEEEGNFWGNSQQQWDRWSGTG